MKSPRLDFHVVSPLSLYLYYLCYYVYNYLYIVCLFFFEIVRKLGRLSFIYLQAGRQAVCCVILDSDTGICILMCIHLFTKARTKRNRLKLSKPSALKSDFRTSIYIYTCPNFIFCIFWCVRQPKLLDFMRVFGIPLNLFEPVNFSETVKKVDSFKQVT